MSDAAIPNPGWSDQTQALRENVSVRPDPSRADVPGDNAADRARTIRRLSRLAFVLDTAIEIPGTKIRLGLDPILGLVPVAGDVLSALLSLYIIIEAARLGATKKILAMMVLNVAIDFAVGSVPVVGDVADVVMKANVRNLKLINIEARW